ncbi:squalene-hopene cyclase [Bacillaceae bacterium JMAK1]|nr:squalene-hopene cyclase [Bacillaceae bacterium JMAK1]
MIVNVSEGIDQLIQSIRADQSEDGSWRYPLESGTFTDAYMIILLRTLEREDETLIRGLAERLIEKQEPNGAWKLFADDNTGNVTNTVEAYYALLYSGYYREDDERMKKARQFIMKSGGIQKTAFLTKIVLTLTGQYKWPSFFPFPIELILVPDFFPINLYSMSVYGRAHVVPLILAADQKLQVKTSRSPDLSDLFASRGEEDWPEADEWERMHTSIVQRAKRLIRAPQELHLLARSRAKLYMTNGIEEDGTLFSYFTSTMFMIFGLLALGHSKDDPLIEDALEGLYGFQTTIDGHPHIQFTTATVWNTALLSYALQEAGVRTDDAMIERANDYLLDRQQEGYGDWAMHNKKALPGGWGFSDVNTFQPDVDDTTAALRALARKAEQNQDVYESWNRGVRWTISMQNHDHGWSAFEKNTDSWLLAMLPIPESRGILTDPSTPDLTGRTMELLGNYTDVKGDDAILRKAVKWLEREQERDGSFKGQWGVNYLYGTWAALTGMKASGVGREDKTVKKAIDWLKEKQNKDGGFGESCLSDRYKRYTSLDSSHLTQTAWVLDSLVAMYDVPNKTMYDALHYVLDRLEDGQWPRSYPAGKGLADRIYFHYHSYEYIYPLLALAHYKNKYGDSPPTL